MVDSNYIKKCRLCRSNLLVKIVNFGQVSLGNDLRSSKRSSMSTKKYPLNLVRCKSCSHFQLNFSVSPKKLYATNYTYLSGVAQSFVDHFKNYANWINKRCKLEKNSLILDVGSNDGSC